MSIYPQVTQKRVQGKGRREETWPPRKGRCSVGESAQLHGQREGHSSNRHWKRKCQIWTLFNVILRHIPLIDLYWDPIKPTFLKMRLRTEEEKESSGISCNIFNTLYQLSMEIHTKYAFQSLNIFKCCLNCLKQLSRLIRGTNRPISSILRASSVSVHVSSSRSFVE